MDIISTICKSTGEISAFLWIYNENSRTELECYSLQQIGHWSTFLELKLLKIVLKN